MPLFLTPCEKLLDHSPLIIEGCSEIKLCTRIMTESLVKRVKEIHSYDTPEVHTAPSSSAPSSAGRDFPDRHCPAGKTLCF